MAEAQTAETKQPYADILQNVGRPSLSATSDGPIIDLAKPQQEEAAETVDTEAEPKDTGETATEEVAGEADGQPQAKAEEVGEKDRTSPQQRAAFARERNRRQAAEQRQAALEAQLAQLTEAVSKLAGDQKPKEDPRPARDAFNDADAYDKALEDWSARRATEKAKAEARAEFEQQQRERQVASLQEAFNERKAAFEADHDDFDDVVYSDDVKISAVMAQAILEAEDGPAIAYFLGQNPEESERIAEMSPARAAIEIGKISTKLAAPPPKVRTAPIRPLHQRNSEPKAPAEESMDEYGARRLAELRKKTN